VSEKEREVYKMRKKYKVIIAFLLTILLAFSSAAMVFAEETGEGELQELDEQIQRTSEGLQPDGEELQNLSFEVQSVIGNTSVHFMDGLSETITDVVVYFGNDTITLTKGSGNVWDGSDSKDYILSQLTKVVVTFSEYGDITYQGSDLGPQGHGIVEPMEYSAEGSGSINLWLNSILNLDPEVSLVKSVDQSIVNSKSIEVIYTFTVLNSGETDLKAVVLKDELLGIDINIGKLVKGAGYTTQVAFNLSNLSEDRWDEDNTFTNTAEVSGKYGKVTVSDSYQATVTYNPEYIAPGKLRIIKNVPNVTDSAVYFNFNVYNAENNVVATGSAAEVDSLLIQDLEPGTYVVEEESASGYETLITTQEAIVVSGNIKEVTFVNTLIINNPDTSEAAIQIVKDVAPATVNSKSASVTYTFKITNNGDYDFDKVILSDPQIGIYEDIGSLAAEATTSKSITFNLGLLGTFNYGSWNGNTFTNTATATGYYGQESISDDDPATVTYSSGGTDNTPNKYRGTVTVQDEETPAAPVPETVIPVLDEEIPAAPLPKTGGFPALALYGIGALLAAGGAGLKYRARSK
jgi:LPXTG-motif cell wall-anchored protein